MIIVPKKFGRQNSAYRHLNMRGAFGNEGALPFSIRIAHGDFLIKFYARYYARTFRLQIQRLLESQRLVAEPALRGGKISDIMANYDFTASLSPLDFELLSKDLLEAELGIQLENFSEGRDKGIDLRYAPVRGAGRMLFNLQDVSASQRPPEVIVQCKRYSSFGNLKSELKSKELEKITKLNPSRYILTTSASLSPQQVEELKVLLSPFVQSTGDIYGRERLNSVLTEFPEIERRHLKLWLTSAGVLDSIINAGTHVVSREEVERTIAAAKLYVRNPSFDEALEILRKHHVCIISGLPGIGKTTLARMLLLYFFERRYDVIKIESDISEARAVGYHKRARFYYYDDFLGQTAQADKLNKNEDQKLLDFMASVRDSKDSVFVLTTREYILNQAKLHYEKLDRENFDHRTCIIDLAKYSRRIRAQILYNHLHFSNLPRPHLAALVAKRGYLRIVDHPNYNPRLIQYLTDSTWIGETKSADYLGLFLSNLDNPVEIWRHAFRNQLSDKARHLLFVLTTMPRESLIPDLERAFSAFHNSQCSRLGIAHSTTDFKNALKELDSTFVATRKVRDSVLVRFQNPSIRDFMQNLMLGGELLSEVIDSITFFEQARWFVDTLRDEQPRVSLEQLAAHASLVLSALQRLFETESCSFSVVGYPSSQYVSSRPANPSERLISVAGEVANQRSRDGHNWIEEKLSDLATRVEAGSLSPSRFDETLEQLKDLGCFASAAGTRLMFALTGRALSQPSDLDEFETLANLIRALPQCFSESDLQTTRQAYSEFVEGFETDNDSPEDIRQDASRIGDVGALLHVDTDFEQERLRDLADENEKEQESRWDDDDERGGGGGSEICSDRELDSMFGTLER
jgi:Novel STAND NTPase 3/Restriction endonuclease